MALIQLDMKQDNRMEIPSHEVIKRYNSKITLSKNLMEKKIMIMERHGEI